MIQTNAVPAYEDTPDKRGAMRARIELEARISGAGEDGDAVLVRNISTLGCLLDARGMAIGSGQLAIALPGLDQPIGLDIVYGDGAYLGVRFQTPLDEEFVAKLVESHSGRRLRLL
ncbi:MAG: hypothetical protein RLN87_01020 [Parasphingopyxis sp.]|uniref:hypothetical protein n=1 Tax=Parasphingopyxis sp. TaxID=1920299 RepID=UPI002636C95E|nr:hypothetical protein [uncultured Parasphingopyxis sp.]